MQKYFYQVQQSTVKYHFSFRTLSDRNMKMGCYAVFFLQTQAPSQGLHHFRQNTQFPRNFGRFARKFVKTFSLRKILSLGKLGQKASILSFECM